MKIVCCICAALIGEKPGDQALVSHGYCKSCFENAMDELRKEYKDEQENNNLGKGK